jgi:hypothetical protein
MANKKNALTIVLIVLIIINTAALTTLFIWHRPFEIRIEREFHHGKRSKEFLKQELNLSDEQSKKMDELKVAHRDTLGFWAEKMREKRNFLTMEMMKTTPNDSLLNATCDEIGVIYATIRKLNIVHYKQVKALCNDEQKRKLDTLFKGIFSCDDNMMGRGGKMMHQSCGPNDPMESQGCGAAGQGEHQGCSKDMEKGCPDMQ